MYSFGTIVLESQLNLRFSHNSYVYCESMRPETNANRAYKHLREKLIAGDFEPGTRLLYGPIGKEIGVSATPVREAAGQLAKEGFVELIPQIGAVVRSIDQTELRELYEVRELIEPYTAARAAERATPVQVKQIEAELDLMKGLAQQQADSGTEFADKRLTDLFNKADYTFHLYVIEASGNQALVRTATQSHVLTQVFGIRRHRHDEKIMRDTCSDHERILSAIRSGNASKAQSAAADHIRKGLALSILASDSN